MPAIGDRTVNLHTVDRHETIYAGSTDSVTHRDQVALRRTLPTGKSKDLRTNLRFERGIASAVDGEPEKIVVVSVTCTVPPGVTPALADAYIGDTLTQAASIAGGIAISGDIHLSA